MPEGCAQHQSILAYLLPILVTIFLPAVPFDMADELIVLS